MSGLIQKPLKAILEIASWLSYSSFDGHIFDPSLAIQDAHLLLQIRDSHKILQPFAPYSRSMDRGFPHLTLLGVPKMPWTFSICRSNRVEFEYTD